MTVELSNSSSQRETFESLKKILGNYQGSIPVYISFIKKDNEKVRLLIGKELYINPTPELVNDVENLVGKGAVALAC